LFLKTDGAGNLSFSSDLPTTSFTGATVETSIADSDLVLIYDDSATAVRKMTKANLVAGIGASAGQVIQVVSTNMPDTFFTSANSQTGTFADVTGTPNLSVTITPSSASNKILILCNINASAGANAYTFWKLLRGSTSIGEGNSDGASRIECIRSQGMDFANFSDGKMNQIGFNYLDSPATTSATTYKIQCSSYGNTIYVNYNGSNQNDTFSARTSSTITALEIKG